MEAEDFCWQTKNLTWIFKCSWLLSECRLARTLTISGTRQCVRPGLRQRPTDESRSVPNPPATRASQDYEEQSRSVKPRDATVGRCCVSKRLRWCERGDSNPHGFTRQILSSRRTKAQRLTSSDTNCDELLRKPVQRGFPAVPKYSVTLGRVWWWAQKWAQSRRTRSCVL